MKRDLTVVAGPAFLVPVLIAALAGSGRAQGIEAPPVGAGRPVAVPAAVQASGLDGPEAAALYLEGPPESEMADLGREAGILNGVDVRGMTAEELRTHPEALVEPSRLVEGEDLKAAVARAKVRIDVDLEAQRLTLREPGAEPRAFKISSGMKGFRTPTGCFIVDQTMRMAYSSSYGGSPMPYSVFFKGGTKYATHGTTHTGQLGSPASHGCVRLRPDDARIVYEAVRRYDPGNTEKNALICISGKPPLSI